MYDMIYIRTAEAPCLKYCIRSSFQSVHLDSHLQSDFQVLKPICLTFVYCIHEYVFLFLISRYRYTWLGVLCTSHKCDFLVSCDMVKPDVYGIAFYLVMDYTIFHPSPWQPLKRWHGILNWAWGRASEELHWSCQPAFISKTSMEQ